MSRRRLVLLVLLGVLVLGLVGGVVAFRPVALTATGYAAKVTCSAVYVSGRDLDDAMGDLPDNPLVPLLRTSVDRSEGTLTASLLGRFRTTGYWTPGFGCTLADERPDFVPLDALPPLDPAVPWPEGDGPPEPVDGIDTDALEAAIATAFTEDDPEGRQRNTRAVVVVKDGQLIAERYGEGFDAATPVTGWSATKSVGSAIVGRLVHEGALTVDDTDLRPAWADDVRSTITVEHLLTMTDGLAFDETYDLNTDATFLLSRPQDAAAFAADKPLEAPPGTRWAYSSGTTNLLCDAAQQAADAGPEIGRDLLFEPLGMVSAVLEPDQTGTPICSSYLYATGRDWARFGQFYLQDGVWDGERLLPEDWVAASTTPVDLPTENPYGWQWWLNEGTDGSLRMPSVPADAFWASGHEGQQVVVIPSEDLVVVRLGFSGAFSGVEWGLEPMVAGIVAATQDAG